jgi:hypothetical protein
LGNNDFVLVGKLNFKFYIINFSYCDDDRFQKDDKDCWAGDHLGDYTHQIISMHSQKYNPEVPTPEITSQPGSNVHLLNDKLINLRNMVLKPVSLSTLGISTKY